MERDGRLIETGDEPNVRTWDDVLTEARERGVALSDEERRVIRALDALGVSPREFVGAVDTAEARWDRDLWLRIRVYARTAVGIACLWMGRAALAIAGGITGAALWLVRRGGRVE